MGGGCWVLGGECWVVMNCCDGRWRVGKDFSLWFFWIMKGWWCHRKGGIITAYIRVFFIIKLLSLLTFRVTLLWVNGLDKIIGWQIWQESWFWLFHLSMVACPTLRGFVAARWSFPLLLSNIFSLILSALLVDSQRSMCSTLYIIRKWGDII